MYWRLIPLTICLFGLLLAGCDSSTLAPEEPESDSTTPAEPVAGAEGGDLTGPTDVLPGSPDALLLQVEQQLPGFGGFKYLPENGVFVAHMTPDGTQNPDEVRAAIESVYGELSEGIRDERREQTAEVAFEIAPAEFTVSELRETRDRALEVLEVDGVHTLDLDEGANRVRIDAANDDAAAGAEAFLQDRDITLEAVTIATKPAPERLTTLRDRVRATRGGLQINFGNALCTYGFTANRGGTRGFVTNAHCTGQMFTNTGTDYYQPSSSSSNYIGTEGFDPGLIWGTYRYSDAAWIQTGDVSPSLLGWITETQGWSYQSGSGSIQLTSRPYVEIDREDNTRYDGGIMDKIGRTTGWTYGRITNTCNHVNMGGYILLCQAEVYAGVGGGDSGSPVFRWKGDTDGDGYYNVDLSGLLWGGRWYPSGRVDFIYSPIRNVEYDLGSLETTL